MNMWIPRDKPNLTPRKLLGEEFFKGSKTTSAMSLEEWEAEKQELKKMADKHSLILKDIRSGKRKTKSVIQFEGAKKKQ